MRDITKLSNEELMALSGGGALSAPTMPDISSLSDEELLGLAGGQGGPAAGGASSPAPKQYLPQAPQGLGRTVLDQGLQGATFGFADEVTDRIGAWRASLATGEKYSDMLKEARGMSKDRMQAQFDQRPVTSIASNIAGGILTGGAGASTKAGTSIANSLRSGGIGARVAKGALAGATSGGAYGAGSAQEGERLAGAGQGALIGGALGAAVPAAGAAISSGVAGTKNAWTGAFARTGDELDQSASVIKGRSSELYKSMREAGATLKPERIGSLADELESAVAATGKNNARLHGDTLSVLDDFKTAAKSGQMGLEELDQYRQLLGDVVSKNTDAIKGMNPDALKASRAIDALDDSIEKLSSKDMLGGNLDAVKALTEARQEWKRYRKFQSVANIVKQADGDPNRLKASLQRFVIKPKNLRGFTKEEVAQLKYAASNTTGEKLLKSLGKFGVDLGTRMTPGNTFLPAAFGAAGAMGVPGGYGLVAGGTAARQGQKYLARGKAEQVLKLIEQGRLPRLTNQ
jgi:hypothetical protein